MHSDAVNDGHSTALHRPIGGWGAIGAFARVHPRVGFGAALMFVFLVAFGLRLIPGVFSPAIAHVDEIFQSIEQGHRLVFGYGIVPWEFQYGARSWLLGYASAGIIETSRW